MRHRRVWSFCTALALAPVPALHRGKENVTMTTILETLLTDVAPFAEAFSELYDNDKDASITAIVYPG